MTTTTTTPTVAHPCFDLEAKHSHSRVHLPVAGKCNIQCNYCNRSYDCVNESRPGVTSALLEPWQAERYLAEIVAADPSVSVVGIAGPGDPFADPEPTLETLRLVRASFPDIGLCVASNGLGLPPHVAELAALGLSHATVTINAVDPAIGAEVYAWVRDGTRIWRGRDAAALLWERQRESVRALAAAGIAVKVNSIIIPGINEAHIAEVARTVAALGATVFNAMPLLPTAGSNFEDLPAPRAETIAGVRAQVQEHLPLMSHCARCRADAVGRIGAVNGEAEHERLRRHAGSTRNEGARPLIAVASHEGVLVDQHLGEAEEILIYTRDEDGSFRQVGIRRAPAKGIGSARWELLAELLSDCRALLVSGIGPSPSAVLRRAGIRVHETEGFIDELLPAAYGGGEVRKLITAPRGCGSGCKGAGTGCA